MTKQAAYTQTEEQVLSSVQSTKEGLTSAQAKERLEKYGPNALQAGEKTTLLQKFINQFKDFMIIVLLAAAVISFFAHEGAPDPTDAIVSFSRCNLKCDCRGHPRIKSRRSN